MAADAGSARVPVFADLGGPAVVAVDTKFRAAIGRRPGGARHHFTMQSISFLSRNKAFRIVKFTQQSGRRPRMTGVGRPRKPRSPKIPSMRLWHSLNVPLPRAPSKRGLQHGGRPVGFAALFTTKACDLRAVEVLVEAGFEEGRAAVRAKSMLEAPARRGPWGSEILKGCQRPLRRGYWAFEHRTGDSNTT